MRKTDWKSGLLWVFCFALTVVVMGWVTRQESDQGLDRDAEQSALRWARLLTDAVPDLEPVFTSGTMTAAARAQLLRLRGDAGLFQFKLFDRSGKLVLLSTDLDKPQLPAYGAAGVAAHGIDPRLRAQVLTGVPYTALHRVWDPKWPQVYSEVDLPVVQQGKTLGMAQLFIDQTQRAAAAAEGLTRIALVVSALLAMIGALAAYQQVAGRKTQRLAEDKLRYLAKYDVLSGALNRASFVAVLKQALARKGDREPSLSLLRIDLDRFKDINDALGHAVGDEVLRVTTQRLKACLRPQDRLARLEGDEFAILLTGPRTREAVTPVARQINQAMAEPIELSGHHVRCSGSIGIALYGADGQDADALMTRAELALFRAKSAGRATFVFHDAERDQEMMARRELTRELRTALAEKQLSVHYQPLFGSDAKLLVGYEALLRWNHPTRGNVPPAVFIPLAEEGGLIDEIGLWVLRQACRDATRWPAPLTVAVNLSVNQFASGNLVRHVSGALADSGLAPERLGLEITESLLLNNSEQVMQTLRKLGALGVSIAMDDFGTGFSSLAYLWRFPFDKLKIDQVFTKNMSADPKVAMIVRSIIMLAHSLEIRVNAEGVETASQLAMLQDLGCEELQGFLLGRPGPDESLTHKGRIMASGYAMPRGEARESLFATIAMDLPAPHSGI